MCGRYVLHLRPSEVRQQLQQNDMPADECPDDDDSTIRQSYNFAPGYHGLVYRADVPDSGAKKQKDAGEDGEVKGAEEAHKDDADGHATKETKYKLQGMKWGLIPFWTKRSPDYGSMIRTINCRDDSLSTSGGMWNTMKQKKRCIVVCEGFFEWQKKNNGKEKIPHFIKRKDGQLMCFAGLWDCVKYEDTEDKLYTYTIITTSSNKQLGWLHDRMPVIFDAGSEAIRTWLDPGRAEWSQDLQSLLKPYSGELELYPVDRSVGKVGNNSPSFVIPIDSKENKKNIANFFGNQAAKKEEATQKVKQEEEEDPESNAPLPKPDDEPEIKQEKSLKREAPGDEDVADSTPKKALKNDKEDDASSKAKSPAGQATSGRKTRSSTSNNTTAKSPSKSDGSKKITSFFGK
ncbi:SOS response associated peptidase (SRAP)-like protein [Elsinoe fawcettii]|nr:SOS response associated peptidase (SRAP)-like protein [Elsinoe fawcettii]